MLLPISPLAQRLKNNAPSLLGILILAVIGISLAMQSAELLRLLRAPSTSPEQAINNDSTPTAQAPLGQLFGPPQENADGPAPATNLQLTLLGSFVHSDPQRSSALIQRQGQPAQRYRVGSEVDNGVRLDSVQPDHVELRRNGRLESLAFPKPNSSQPSTYVPPAEPNAGALDQLDQLQQDNMQQLQERMQALRQQMENNGSSQPQPQTDQPLDND
ncbi:Type II secretion system protein N [Pseudomonas sp. 8Z]|uniref:type II secretion system protein N n=1 Tax=Pseudomonas sp. 8Z TaxID=2653166 RepID=UPI0012F3F78F|nr:type II secretion system protein N [Pseudomonas sp. 8Z]VXC64690.1 Type II secretion system protein N [Pseudomonas sp. 8Z]